MFTFEHLESSRLSLLSFPFFDTKILNSVVWPKFEQLITIWEKFPDFIFDLVLIDGRVRPYCAEIALQLSHENTNIFIHDYQPDLFPDRLEYRRVNKFLDFQEQIHNLARFKPKPGLIPEENKRF